MLTQMPAARAVQEIQEQLKTKNNYPCGGQHERTTFPSLYRNAVAPVLAGILSQEH